MLRLRNPSSHGISFPMSYATQKAQLAHLSELKAVSEMAYLLPVALLSEKDQQLWKVIEKEKRGRIQQYQWNLQEEKLLYRLHDFYGNKWASISQHFQGINDNNLKNHFFSRLRMSIRHLNKHATKIMGKKVKIIKNHVLYKIISICDQRYNNESKVAVELINFSINLKNRLLNYLHNSKVIQSDLVQKLIVDIHHFGKKNRTRKCQGQNKQQCNQQYESKPQSANIYQPSNINIFWNEEKYQSQLFILQECQYSEPRNVQDSFLSLKSSLPIELQVISMKQSQHSLFSKQSSIEASQESIHSPTMTVQTPPQDQLLLIQKSPIILASNPFLSIEYRLFLQSFNEQEYFAQLDSEERCKFGNYFILEQMKSHQRLNSF